MNTTPFDCFVLNISKLIRKDEGMEILEYLPLLNIVGVVKEVAELLFYCFAIVYIVKNIKK